MTNIASTNAGQNETHGSERPSLMLRSAKVICQTGEYICIIREVSALGTSLAFLHEIPPETRILLSLGNGLIFPIERVWAGKTLAGYRFGCVVTVAEFQQDHEPFAVRPIRLSISAPGRVIDGHEQYPVNLCDISTDGAKFESAAVHTISRLISFHVRGLDQQLGKIVWQDRGLFGLRFQQPIELKALALAALKLQPYDKPIDGGFCEALAKARAA